MIKGAVISGVVAVAAITGVVLAFSNGGSPYVTWAQAQQMKGDAHLHLAGDLLKDSMSQDLTHHTLRFKLKDQDGAVVTVIHTGEVPQNMSEVTKVVAIGHADGGVFTSDQLLVKCPSKYEAQPSSGKSGYKTS